MKNTAVKKNPVLDQLIKDAVQETRLSRTQVEVHFF